MTTSKRLLVLSPVMTAFDRSVLERMLASFAAAGFELLLQDSLVRSSPTSSTQSLADDLFPSLEALQPDAAIGFSFGGAILQHMAGREAWGQRPMILMSSPIRPSSNLRAKLERICSLLSSGDLEGGIREHEANIWPIGSNSPASSAPCDQTGADRVFAGLQMLLEHDGRTSLASAKAPVLACIGGSSRLVTAEDATPAKGVLLTVAGAGMRPLTDAPAQTTPILLNFLQRNLR